MFIYFDLPYFSDKIRRILITILLLIPIARRISSEKSCRCLTNRHSRDSRNCVARQTRLFSRSKRAKVAVKKKRRISRNSPLPSQQLINIFIETFRSISAAFPIARKIPSSFRTWTLTASPNLRRIPLSSIRPNRCNIHQFYPRGFLTRLRRIQSLNGRTNRGKKERRSCFLVIEHACRLPHCSSGNFFHPRDPKRRSFEPPSSRPQDLRSLRPLRSR